MHECFSKYLRMGTARMYGNRKYATRPKVFSPNTEALEQQEVNKTEKFGKKARRKK